LAYLFLLLALIWLMTPIASYAANDENDTLGATVSIQQIYQIWLSTQSGINAPDDLTTVEFPNPTLEDLTVNHDMYLNSAGYIHIHANHDWQVRASSTENQFPQQGLELWLTEDGDPNYILLGTDDQFLWSSGYMRDWVVFHFYLNGLDLDIPPGTYGETVTFTIEEYNGGSPPGPPGKK